MYFSVETEVGVNFIFIEWQNKTLSDLSIVYFISINL